MFRKGIEILLLRFNYQFPKHSCLWIFLFWSWILMAFTHHTWIALTHLNSTDKLHRLFCNLLKGLVKGFLSCNENDICPVNGLHEKKMILWEKPNKAVWVFFPVILAYNVWTFKLRILCSNLEWWHSQSQYVFYCSARSIQLQGKLQDPDIKMFS